MPDNFVTKVGLDAAINDYVRQDAKPAFDNLRFNSILLGMNNLIGTGGATGAETILDEGSNITITGTGTSIDPYIISSTSSGGGGTGSLEDDQL